MEIDNLQLINAVLYVMENNCKWMAWLKKVQREKEQKYLLTDRAYEGENIRAAALEQVFEPIVLPEKNRRNPWVYDKERYKRRNEIERFFLRLKCFRRIFTRYDKLERIW